MVYMVNSHVFQISIIHSSSHRADLGHSGPSSASQRLLEAECGLRYGTEMVNGGDISNQLISAGKCSLCLSRCDQSVTTVGVCWWNCLGTSMFVNVRRCSSCSYGKDLKSFAHIPRCPDAAWIDDRNVSTKKFMGQNKHCFR